MSRRVLTVALGAASLAFVPTAAGATPDPAPVELNKQESYYAFTEMVFADGRRVDAQLGQVRGVGDGQWRGQLSVGVQAPGDCSADAYWCPPDMWYGSVTLTDDEVNFSRNLSSASTTDIGVTLKTSDYDWVTDQVTYRKQDVIVSVSFESNGDITRAASHSTRCGDGMRECQSTRVSAERAATGTVTLDDVSGTGDGFLSYGHGIDAAAPKIVDDGGW